MKVLVSRNFESFEQFADLIVSWRLDFLQLSSEQGKPTLFQAQFGSMLVSHARFTCFVEQRGATPEAMRTFAVFDEHAPAAHWFGHTVGPNDLLVFPVAGDIDVISRPGFGVTTISIPEHQINTWFTRYAEQDAGAWLRPDEMVVSLTALQMKSLRYLLQSMMKLASHTVESDFERFRKIELEEQFMLALFEIFTGKPGMREMMRPGGHDGLKRVLDYARSNADEVLTASDLCSVAKVSERTLQYLFKHKLGMTPRSFVASRRLYQAHRALWRADASATSVSDTANNWGFAHLGQFAADYRKQFGELPSVTLRRTVGNGSLA